MLGGYAGLIALTRSSVSGESTRWLVEGLAASKLAVKKARHCHGHVAGQRSQPRTSSVFGDALRKSVFASASFPESATVACAPSYPSAMECAVGLAGFATTLSVSREQETSGVRAPSST